VTVVASAPGWNVTVPVFLAPLVLRHEMSWSGRCSTISAAHSLSRPPTVAFQ
jgi:hypothetical protein